MLHEELARQLELPYEWQHANLEVRRRDDDHGTRRAEESGPPRESSRGREGHVEVQDECQVFPGLLTWCFVDEFEVRLSRRQKGSLGGQSWDPQFKRGGSILRAY